MANISEYITEEEYRCSHCRMLPVEFSWDNPDYAQKVMFDGFDIIREQWGGPLRITSGYRCATYNQLINGAPLSAHQFGVAVDIDCHNEAEVEELAQLIESLFPDFRRGEYTIKGTFIHIDTAYLIQPKATLLWSEGRRWSG